MITIAKGLIRLCMENISCMEESIVEYRQGCGIAAKLSARTRGYARTGFNRFLRRSGAAARTEAAALFAEDPDDAQDSADGEEDQQGDEGAPEHSGQPAGRRPASGQRQLVNDRDEDRRYRDQRADRRFSYDLDKAQILSSVLTAGPSCRVDRGLFLRS